MDELRWFTLKKSVLLAFCAIDIIVYVVYASAAKHFATKFISENSKVSQDNNSTTNSALSKDEELVTTIRLIVLGSLVGILFQAIGIIGAIRHNLCLSSTYSIAMTVGAVIAIVRSYNNLSRHWMNTVWSVAVATTALLFLWDLYYRAQIKRLKRNSVKMKRGAEEMIVMKAENKTALNGSSKVNLNENRNEEEGISFILTN